MGCWNGTCVITNLPIFSGDPVKLIALMPSETRTSTSLNGRDAFGHCYATDLSYPVGFPLSGFYNDYGSIEDYDENSIAAQFLSHIADEPVNEVLTGEHKKELCMQFVLAHNKAFDYFLKSFPKQNNNKAILRLMLSGKDSTHFPRFALAHNDAFSDGSNKERLYTLITKLAPITDDKKVNAIVEEIVAGQNEIHCFIKGMNVLRKMIYPPSGTGSQQANLKNHADINQISLEIIKDRLISDVVEKHMDYAYKVMLGDEDY